MESSHRNILNDVAEHRSILKSDQHRYYPRFSLTPKTRAELPKTGVSFLLCSRREFSTERALLAELSEFKC